MDTCVVCFRNYMETNWQKTTTNTHNTFATDRRKLLFTLQWIWRLFFAKGRSFCNQLSLIFQISWHYENDITVHWVAVLRQTHHWLSPPGGMLTSQISIWQYCTGLLEILWKNKQKNKTRTASRMLNIISELISCFVLQYIFKRFQSNCLNHCGYFDKENNWHIKKNRLVIYAFYLLSMVYPILCKGKMYLEFYRTMRMHIIIW